MPFIIPIDQAKADFPEYTFVAPLTPSEQKCAFHVRDKAGEDLCLKIIAPSFRMDRLQREILALQAISHRNVVKLREYTFSTSQGKQRHYLIEEFVAGQDLSSYIRPGIPMELTRAIPLFKGIADGLAALLSAGVVHRDLKPNNIRVRVDASPVIIDFGLARHLGLEDITQTAEGAAIGTPRYFAPEQFIGTKREIDHRTDLFALGVLLYEAVVGQHPFLWPSVTTLEQLAQAVCTGTDHLADARFLAQPNSIRVLISKLLEKDRARRPRDATQVLQILSKLRVNA
jgi:eukaryotic-like serine/threonine-protein kinase